MPNNSDEQNRSQQIHDDRLSARNRPSSLSKRNASTKQAKRVEEKKFLNQKPLLVEFFNVLPRAWKGLVIGIFVGMIPLVALFVLRPEWNIFGLLSLVLFGTLGFIIGKMTQRKLVRRS